MDYWSIFLGIFAGYVVGNILGRLFSFRAEKQTITMAQIQSLRLFSQSIVQYGHLRQWHDTVAIGMDDIKKSIVEELNSGIKLESGEIINLPSEKINEVSTLWYNRYEQELKGVWNSFEWDMKQFKDASVNLIAESSGVHKAPYTNWSEAMSWLMRFELLLKQKEKEESQANKAEGDTDET